MSNTATTVRPLSVIADEIEQDWGSKGKGVNYAARPYLSVMHDLNSVDEDCGGGDTGKTVVLYFLSNAGTWRGDVARRVKAELKAMING